MASPDLYCRHGALWIAPGMDADLVVLGADPVTDVRAFTNVRYAVQAGRVIYSSSQ